MNKDITVLYSNDIGIAFKWKNVREKNKVQLVFRDTGFYIEPKQLYLFSNFIKKTIKVSASCAKCNAIDTCKSILLETPIKELTFALNRTELYLFNELVLGCIFQLQLTNVLNNLDVNF